MYVYQVCTWYVIRGNAVVNTETVYIVFLFFNRYRYCIDLDYSRSISMSTSEGLPGGSCGTGDTLQQHLGINLLRSQPVSRSRRGGLALGVRARRDVFYEKQLGDCGGVSGRGRAEGVVVTARWSVPSSREVQVPLSAAVVGCALYVRSFVRGKGGRIGVLLSLHLVRT